MSSVDGGAKARPEMNSLLSAMSCLSPATSPSVAITSDVVSAETVAVDPSAGPANDAVQSSEPVSEMTYTLLSRTLNPSIPYHTNHQSVTTARLQLHQL